VSNLSPQLSKRFLSGNQRLDAVLGGGLPANAINMIIGLPGAGKTILAEQFMFHNASPERPGLYLSTVSEPRDKFCATGRVLPSSMLKRLARASSSKTWEQALMTGG
jgi:archaellum biogenesis ATPase FlaH